ncbi:MAG: tetratricopeptide repeat protein [Promethearchaeota archaeon]
MPYGGIDCITELAQARKLIFDRKMDEALDILSNFEQKEEISLENKLSIFLLKGRIYAYYWRYFETVEMGEQAYLLSKQLGIISSIIEALNLRAYMTFTGKIDTALEIILEVERFMVNLPPEMQSSSFFQEINISNMFLHFTYYMLKAEYDDSLKLANQFSSYIDTIGGKDNLAISNYILAYAYMVKGKPDVALDHAFKSLELYKDLEQDVWIAELLYTIGNFRYYKGELEQSLNYLKQSFSIENVSDITKAKNFEMIGSIYREKGELEKALENFMQASVLAEVSYSYEVLAASLLSIGSILRIKGDLNQAISHLKRSTKISEEAGYNFYSFYAFLQLILIYLDNDSIKDAERLVTRLKDLDKKMNLRACTLACMLAEALLLKKLGRTRNRAEAEILLKNIIEEGRNMDYQIYVLALLSFSNHLLEELTIYNDQAIIEEINPLILKIERISERQGSYSYFAEAKLLQAKLALIQMNVEESKKLLTEAQQIAEAHNLTLLAQNISTEHDILLEKVTEWDILKERDAPMSERISLANISGVIDRLKGSRAVEPTEIIPEDPLLLLIMSRAGVSLFNHSFRENWDVEWLFSSFMSAFNTFSSELFSESIDRIKIGDNLILITPIESFLICYVINGQSYPGLQKLNRFSNAIRENTEIWDTLKRAINTGEVLELNKPSSLGIIVNDIFG